MRPVILSSSRANDTLRWDRNGPFFSSSEEGQEEWHDGMMAWGSFFLPFTDRPTYLPTLSTYLTIVRCV